MSLLRNSFYVLGVSVRDRRQAIIEAADMKALLVDSEQMVLAKNTLINPRNRLEAEVSWLPGVSPKRALQYIDDIQVRPGILLESLIGIAPLAQCNILVTILELTPCTDAGLAIQIFWRLTKQFDAIEVEEVLRLINEDREVAGFSAVQNEALIEDQLRVLEKSYVSVMESSIAKMKNSNVIMGEMVKLALLDTDGVSQLLEQVVDRSRLGSESELQTISTEVEELLNEMSCEMEFLKDFSEEIPGHIQHLEKIVELWNQISIPYQLLDNYHGFDEAKTTDLVRNIRSYYIELSDEHHLYDEALQIVLLLKENFPLLNILSEKLEEDEKTLSELLKKKKRSEEIRAVQEINDQLFNLCKEIVKESESKVVRNESSAVANLIHCNRALENFRKECKPLYDQIFKYACSHPEIYDDAKNGCAYVLYTIAIDYTWANDFIKAEALLKEACSYEPSSKLAQKIDEALTKMIKNATLQKQHQKQMTMMASNTKQEKSTSSFWKWAAGIVAIVFFYNIFLSGNNDQKPINYSINNKNKSSVQPKAAERADISGIDPLKLLDSVRSNPENTAPIADPLFGKTETNKQNQFEKPPIGRDNVLSIAQIRWCLREKIRLEAMRPLTLSNKGVVEFNQMINDYNQRGGSYRYKTSIMQQAQKDVEAMKASIASDAITEAKTRGWID